MARKKRGKRSNRNARRTASKNLVRSNQRKISLVLKNLIVFAVLFVLSLVLYMGSSKDFYINLFAIFLIIFGFLALAFFIVLLIFIFMKALKR